MIYIITVYAIDIDRLEIETIEVNSIEEVADNLFQIVNHYESYWNSRIELVSIVKGGITK
jgi:hypothetical protein